MKRIYFLSGLTLALGVVLGTLGSRMSSAEESWKGASVLQRSELKGPSGLEAILVLRNLPPNAQSGNHTHPGNEIVYILEGSAIVAVQGKPPVTLQAGDSFSIVAGEVHNVKNASATTPAKALTFYVANKGTSLQDLGVGVHPSLDSGPAK
jgi:quercetin dioxygenase-like cupin family protein